MSYKNAFVFLFCTLVGFPLTAQEQDRGTVKQPDYVAIPHSNENAPPVDEVSRTPNRSLADDKNQDGVVSPDEWIGTRESFAQLDTNDDGVLSERELESYIQIGMDEFAEQDTNHDGVLTIDEWQDRKYFFKKMDKDENGILSRSEFYSEP